MATLQKVIKPMSKDTSISDQPEGHPRHVKNGISSEKMGTWINEPGFAPSSISFPTGYTVIGIVPTDQRVVFMLAGATSSEIGTYDPKTDTYTTIVNDPKFGFTTQKYITGKYRYNYLRQLVIAWTDSYNIPYTINIDSPASTLTQFEQYSLFPVSRSPVIHPVTAGSLVVPGGSLLSGTYFVLVKYRNNDYSETNYEISSQPIFIPGSGGIGAASGTVTDWKIQLTLDSVDTSYDKLVIGLYGFAGAGVASFNEIQELPIPRSAQPSVSGMKIVIHGGEAATPLQLAEASVDTAWYDRISTMTDLNGVLYISGLARNPAFAYQSIANQVTVKYVSTTKDMTTASSFSDPGEAYSQRSFRHNEVYALYIAFHYTKGGYTSGFHIPGRASVPGEMSPSMGLATETGNPFSSAAYPRYAGGVPRFKVEDTSDASPVYGFGTDVTTGGKTYTLTGSLGYWENNNETYPVDPVTWGALSGMPVRHHKFPSIRGIGASLTRNFLGFAGINKYGKTYLDTLGIKVSNVVIPAALASSVDGYQVYFAKRTLSNSCVIAQSLYMCGTAPNSVDQSIRSTGCNSNVTSFGADRVTQRLQNGTQFDPGNPPVNLNPTGVMNHGMDWLAGPNLDHDPSSTDRAGEGLTDVQVNFNYLRFHSFDLLSQPTPMAVNPDYIWNDLSFPYDQSFNPAYYGDNHSPNNTNHDGSPNIMLDVFNKPMYRWLDGVFSVLNFDYAAAVTLAKLVPTKDVVRNVEPAKTYYVPNNTVVDQVHNILSEGCLALQLKAPAKDPSTAAPFGAFPTASNYTMLTSLMRVVDDAYYGFSRQSLASCGDMQPVTGPGVMPPSTWTGADTFIAFYGFTTYTGDVIRLVNTAAQFLVGGNNSGPSPATYIGDQIGGRMTHYFLGEFSGNPQMRHEDLANPYSKFYPRSKGAQILVRMLRTTDPNQIQYNHDYSRVADIRVPVPFDPYLVQVNDFPYRVARGGRQQAEARKDNWRSFLPLDYYESTKDYGPIINLGTYDFRLIIHHQYYARITKDKATLNTSALSVVLGSGDIFDIEPTTLVPYEHGFGGTSHNLACYTTPAGYVFLDADINVGNMFLYDSKLKSLSPGLSAFLRDHLSLVDRNIYQGNGITLAYDPRYRRIVVAVKNKKLPPSLAPIYAGELTLSPDQLSRLIPGTSVVQYKGSYYTFIS